MSKIFPKDFFEKARTKLESNIEFQRKKTMWERELASFQTKFNIKELSKKNDDELVNALFQNKNQTKDNLYSVMAFNEGLPVKVKAVTPFMLGAAYIANDINDWVDSKMKPIKYEKVVAIAKDIRESINKITDLIVKNKNDVYGQIDEVLKTLFREKIKINAKVIYGKYLASMWPDLFPPFFNEGWQKFILEDDYVPDKLAVNFKKIKKIADDVGLDSLTFGECIWSNFDLPDDNNGLDNYKDKFLNQLEQKTYSISELFENKITRCQSEKSLKKRLTAIADAFPFYFKLNKKENTFEILRRKDLENCATSTSDFIKEDQQLCLVPSNMLYYGIPGCGKSFSVDKFVNNVLQIKDNNKNKIRTTFYLDYSYNDFVGQLMPFTSGKDVRYKINPGPFTKALSEAYKTSMPVVLIIEEINRGNAPAIFGDVFQLLDRNNNGESVFGIDNIVINQYLSQEKIQNPFGDKIKLPSNLWILATMNSSDQNVFKLDTAFKRRWIMKRMTNESSRNDAESLNNFKIPGTNLDWILFVDRVNKAILDNGLTEDRQLGYWFVLKDNINISLIDQKDYFSNKVLEYLWNDVLKFQDNILFSSDIHSFDELIEKYNKDPESIFRPEIING